MSRKSLPTHKVIIDHWMHEFERGPSSFFPVDWEVPICFACRAFCGSDREITGVYRSKQWFSNIYAAWEKAKLERCHIITDSLGGINKPSNIVFLCKECHTLSPDTGDTAVFFKWCNNQSWLKRGYSKIEDGFNSFGIDVKDKQAIAPILDLFSSDERVAAFKKFAADNISLHAGRLSMASLVGALLSFCKTEMYYF